MDLLRGFGPAQWAQPTICPGWDVKDVAAHVLGDHIGRLSRHRDGHPPDTPASTATSTSRQRRSRSCRSSGHRRIPGHSDSCDI
ncbi:MAG TPA: maleylpyruvate isomerase N-terminal domain-containing protein [Streptosporangiaceae bacterium]|nr:maleylpyruvate isomerase N-terminal domain-containing protein [Streptosporangiaceae bacterium]